MPVFSSTEIHLGAKFDARGDNPLRSGTKFPKCVENGRLPACCCSTGLGRGCAATFDRDRDECAVRSDRNLCRGAGGNLGRQCRQENLLRREQQRDVSSNNDRAGIGSPFEQDPDDTDL